MTWSTIPLEDHAQVAGSARAGIPAGWMAQPVEIARSVWFLASDEASFVTEPASSRMAGSWPDWRPGYD
jgi:NAD(P)-dependent dehydrogenase (short-subunit alcohol dehydrogenase family)